MRHPRPSPTGHRPTLRTDSHHDYNDLPNHSAPTPSPHGRRSRRSRRTKIITAVGALTVLGAGIPILGTTLDQRHHTSLRFTDQINVLDLDASGGTVKVIGTTDPYVTVDIFTHDGLQHSPHAETVCPTST